MLYFTNGDFGANLLTRCLVSSFSKFSFKELQVSRSSIWSAGSKPWWAASRIFAAVQVFISWGSLGVGVRSKHGITVSDKKEYGVYRHERPAYLVDNSFWPPKLLLNRLGGS